MEPLTDVLIYLAIIGCAAVVIGALLWGIYRLIGKIHDLGREDRRILANRQYMRGRLGNEESRSPTGIGKAAKRSISPKI